MRAASRAIETMLHAAMWLALPLAFLLFAQWPLRDLVQAYSREANDLGQILFALYIAVAITAATREGAHLAVDAVARRYTAGTRARIARIASAVVLVPWAVFIMWMSCSPVWQSALQLERFADTLNPGYFIIRFAVLLMAALVLAQAIVDIFTRGE
jgi:TRAP-type mannitol/chloroaromatic compound transport system permease small subunit